MALPLSVTLNARRILGIKCTGSSKATMKALGLAEPVHRVATAAWRPLSSSDGAVNLQHCRRPAAPGNGLFISPASSAGRSLLSSAAVAYCSSARFSADIKAAAAAPRRIWCAPARDEHAHDVARLMEWFVSSEPQLTAASVSDSVFTDASFRPRLVAWTSSLIRRGLSVVALEGDAARTGAHDDGRDDGDGVVIAALLNYVMHRDAQAAARDDQAGAALSVCLQHPAAVPIEVGIARVEAEADVFGRLGVDAALAVGYGAVWPHRCGGGILSRLVSAAEALAARRGLQAAVSAASSAFSQSSLRRLGYEELASAEYAGLLDPTLFDLSKLGPHRRLVVLGKRLGVKRSGEMLAANAAVRPVAAERSP